MRKEKDTILEMTAQITSRKGKVSKYRMAGDTGQVAVWPVTSQFSESRDRKK